MKKAFTITELLLAISLMVVLMATSGVVFQTAVKAHRTASATAEIARKLRGITDQLNADFKGLRKDGEIFIAWVPNGVDDDGNGTIDRYERMDRIMFFADGDFQSYDEWPAVLPPPARQTNKIIHGNLARIGYMLAKDGAGDKAQIQDAAERTLARSQHIYTSDSDLVGINTPPNFPLDPLDVLQRFDLDYNNTYEYENLTMQQWLNIDPVEKDDILSIISDVTVGPSTIQDTGLMVDGSQGGNIHQLWCEGVGDFKIQSWYIAPGSRPRWFPEVDPDGDGLLSDTDFFPNGSVLSTTKVPGILYPYVPFLAGDPDDMHGYLLCNSVVYPRTQMDEAHFSSIPGLGRALKFTFTLYDSKGVFKEGKKFTHIVYLDD